MASSPSELPDGLTPEDKLLHVCGSYFLGEGTVLPEYYKESLAMMEKTAPDFRKMQFLKVGKVCDFFNRVFNRADLGRRTTLQKRHD